MGRQTGDVALQEATPSFVLTLNLALLSLGKVVEEQGCALPKSPPPVLLFSLSAGLGVAHGLKNGHFHSDEVVLCAPTRRVTPHPSPAGPLCDFLLTNQLSLCSFDVVRKSLYS